MLKLLRGLWLGLPFVTVYYSSIVMAMSDNTSNSLIDSPCCLLHIPFVSCQRLQNNHKTVFVKLISRGPLNHLLWNYWTFVFLDDVPSLSKYSRLSRTWNRQRKIARLIKGKGQLCFLKAKEQTVCASSCRSMSKEAKEKHFISRKPKK